MVDFTAEKEYSYEYEAGKIVRATECNLDIENEHILHKSVVNTIKYYYDAEERITKVTDSVERATEYAYNANGIRTSKTVNGIKHTYTLDGTKILREEWGENSIVPLYDNEESVCGILYNDEPYYFTKNLQGDIISIVNQNGGTVARYSYDAWGVPTITQDVLPCRIAEINPYRYRGYYYDSEMGMYYLQSRYYAPAVGRFVNADNPGIVLLVDSFDFNSYAYCENNVVNDCDYSGFASYRTRSKTLNKLIEALEKAIPNIYSQDFWCKEKRLLRIGSSNLSLTISCGVAAQTNKMLFLVGCLKKEH